VGIGGFSRVPNPKRQIPSSNALPSPNGPIAVKFGSRRLGVRWDLVLGTGSRPFATLAEFESDSVPAFERSCKPFGRSEVCEGVFGEACWSTGPRWRIRDRLRRSAVGRVGPARARAADPIVAWAITTRICTVHELSISSALPA
jgi:hypothetical protein